MACALALVPGLPPAMATPVLACALAVAPGLIVAPALVPWGGAATRALFALALAPFLVGAPAAALLALGVSPPAAARVVVAATLVAALATAWRRDAPPRAGEGPVPWLAAAAWSVIVAAMLAMNPLLLARDDGWFHAAVTLEIVQRGLPVEDPFFAGLRLLYFWGYHVWSALWLALAPAVSVWAPLVALQITAAIACMLAVTRLAARLGGGPRAQSLAALLAVAGYMPFGWVLVPGRALVGTVRGTAELNQLLARGLDPVMAAMSQGTLHASMAFFGDKFLIATSFALGLALAGAFVLALMEAAERPGGRAWLAVGLVQAAALFLHTVIGWANAIAAAGWWCATAWRARTDRTARPVLRGAALAMAGAVALLLPYMAATAGGKRQVLHFGMNVPTLYTWLIAGGVYVPAGTVWLARAARTSVAARELFGLTVSLTLAALLIGLPLGNQSKLFNVLFLLLAPAAACGWIAWLDGLSGARRQLLAWGLAVAIVPTFALALWGFGTERGQNRSTWNPPASPAVREGLAAARRLTPPDAVFVDASANLDLTVFAGRSALWGSNAWAKNWGYDPAALAQRRHAAETLGRGAAPPPDVLALLTALRRPVIVVARRAAPDSVSAWPALVERAPGSAGAGIAALRPLYANREIAFFRWEPRP